MTRGKDTREPIIVATPSPIIPNFKTKGTIEIPKPRILINVINVTNSSDLLNVTATIDIPISVNNTFMMNDNRASFSGTISVNHSYHVYYFNTSEIAENITGLTIKLTNLQDDIDLFVFNSTGTQMGRSIEMISPS